MSEYDRLDILLDTDPLLLLREHREALRIIDTSVGLLRQLGGMLPGSRQIVDTVVDLLTAVPRADA